MSIMPIAALIGQDLLYVVSKEDVQIKEKLLVTYGLLL